MIALAAADLDAAAAEVAYKAGGIGLRPADLQGEIIVRDREFGVIHRQAVGIVPMSDEEADAAIVGDFPDDPEWIDLVAWLEASFADADREPETAAQAGTAA